MYLAKIEEFFFKYRRQGIILSPQNWLIAERWEQMGIPIHIVCKGIKNTCRKFRSTHLEGEERIDMLTYCEPEILKLWKDYRKNFIGRPNAKREDETGVKTAQHSLSDTIRNRLESIKQDLRYEAVRSGVWGDLKAKALAQIDWSNEMNIIEKEYCQNDQIDIESLERKLSDLDKTYLNTIFQFLSKEQKVDLTKEVEEELSSYKKQMDKDSFKQTLELGIKSLLRKRLKVRRISLYAT